MATGMHNHPATKNLSAAQQPQIECGNCAHALPLRLSGEGELPAVWLCAYCKMPYSAICLKDQLSTISNNIQLDQRYFNTRGFQPVSSLQRQKITNIVNRQSRVINLEKRRSARIDQSLLVSGITLNGDLNPLGVPIQLMVVNLSKEGVGLVTCCPIYASHLALELAPNDNQQIQVIVRVVRERLLDPPFREYGAEFIARLGMASPE
jgi:hypothetical protein